MCCHPQSQDASSSQSTSKAHRVNSSLLPEELKPSLFSVNVTEAFKRGHISELHLTQVMPFSVSWPKSFFQNTTKCQCPAIYHHLESGIAIYSSVSGFAMTRNMKAHMSMPTLRVCHERVAGQEWGWRIRRAWLCIALLVIQGHSRCGTEVQYELAQQDSR